MNLFRSVCSFCDSVPYKSRWTSPFTSIIRLNGCWAVTAVPQTNHLEWAWVEEKPKQVYIFGCLLRRTYSGLQKQLCNAGLVWSFWVSSDCPHMYACMWRFCHVKIEHLWTVHVKLCTCVFSFLSSCSMFWAFEYSQSVHTSFCYRKFVCSGHASNITSSLGKNQERCCVTSSCPLSSWLHLMLVFEVSHAAVIINSVVSPCIFALADDNVWEMVLNKKQLCHWTFTFFTLLAF